MMTADKKVLSVDKTKVLSDEEFARWLNQVSGNALYDDEESRPFVDGLLSDSQLMTICNEVNFLPLYLVELLVAHESLTSDHIDTIISKGVYGDLVALIEICENLTPSHVEACLNCGHAAVQLRSYRHPLCTDAMRVKYHMARGVE